ncbi:GTP-binding protein, partial [SAR202 cluster bacterium AD-804-J14_MRT_500m]|nr:GTP-binding protein [SAR202 cluster bacterium AD-804-J14_MRT_500m]
MPANLTPQYKEAEKRYRQASNLPARIAALHEMMAVVPKHKGTDHLRADLRSRMSRHLAALERPKATSGGGPQPFSLRKEGAGQALIIGLPNSGKSELLNALTGATTKVGDYPFTTQIPQVGMLPFENVYTQLVDTPSLNDRDIQTRLFGLLRNADLILVTVNLSENPMREIVVIKRILSKWGYELLLKGSSCDPEAPKMQKSTILVANKSDMPGCDVRYDGLMAEYGTLYSLVKVSCLDGSGLEELSRLVFMGLGKLRVYTKSPSGSADFDQPIIMINGSTIADAADRLHKDWKTKLKYA